MRRRANILINIIVLMLFCCHISTAFAVEQGGGDASFIPELEWNTRKLNVADGLPSNTIRAIVQDSDGYIWLGGTGGLCRYDGHQVISFFNGDGKHNEERISQVALMSFDEATNTLHITDTDGEFYCLHTRSLLLTKDNDSPNLNPPLPDIVAKTMPTAIYAGEAGGYHFAAERYSGRLWVIDGDGNRRFFDLIPNMSVLWEKEHLFFPAEGPDGRIYIATYGAGLYIVDKNTWTMEHHTAQDASPLFDSDYLQAITIDRSGGIWLSADNTGVARLHKQQGASATFVLPVPSLSGNRTNTIRTVFTSAEGQIFVVCNDDKAYLFDPERLTLTYSATLKGGVYAHHYDEDGRFWRGTRGNGLFIGAQRYATDEPDRKLSHDDITGIAVDKHRRLWLTTNGGGLLWTDYSEETPRIFNKVEAPSALSEKQLSMLLTDGGYLLIAAADGLYTVDTNRRDSIEMQPVHTGDVAHPRNVNTMFTARDGSLWICTMGNGLIHGTLSADGRQLTGRTISRDDGLSSNQIATAIQDGERNIWVCSEQGLTQLDENGRKPRVYIWGNNALGNVYVRNESAMALADGRLLFGTQNGLAVVTPLPATNGEEMESTNIFITNLEVNGTSFFDGRIDILKFVEGTEAIRLRYAQNNLCIYLSTLQYNTSTSSLFQHKLEGIDENWSRPSSEWVLRYNNLSPGHYRLRLRSVDGDSIGQESEVQFVILQPWYNTWWAWSIYAVVILLVVWIIYRQWRRSFLLRQEMHLQKMITELRIDFFTNVTHEFRTPLSIISNSIDKLRNAPSGTAPSSQKATLQTARRGTKRLLKLVNQLIDFKRLNDGKRKLAVSEGDIVLLVRQICDDLRSTAALNDLSLTFRPKSGEMTLLFDADAVETIVYNLVSNAVKYTPRKGQVLVSLTTAADSLIISVEDSGAGVNSEQERVLFQPFLNGKVAAGGMGIGLYNSHCLAKLHHGALTYSRSKHLGGARFTLTLPLQRDIYDETELLHTPLLKKSDDETERQAELIVRELQPEALNDISIAVIEDDPDMMQLVAGEMKTYFNIQSYTRGADALKGIEEGQPELILCDVMLPDMSGYDIVRALKKHPATAKTPIIMLTALTDESHQMRAYQAGADDYMIKPVKFNLLLTRSMQLIKRRREIVAALESAETTIAEQQNNGGNTTEKTSAAPQPIIESAADKRFREMLDHIITERMGDTELNVDALAESMHIGHTKFYTMVSSVTGLSPNKYLTRRRLEQAAHLLKTTTKTAAEIAYEVGFQDPSYFNKVFKHHFQQTTKQFRDSV